MVLVRFYWKFFVRSGCCPCFIRVGRWVVWGLGILRQVGLIDVRIHRIHICNHGMVANVERRLYNGK